MHIQHANSATATLGHDGREYAAVRPGVFNVPDEVGYELIQRADFERYYGEVPYAITGAPAPSLEALSVEAESEPAVPDPPSGGDWHEAGRRHALAGNDRALPEGVELHPRSKGARDFFHGYDSVKADNPGTEAQEAQS